MIYEYDFLDSNQLRQVVSLFDAGKFVDGARKVGQAMNENAKEFDRVQNIIGKKGADKLSAFASSTKTLSKTFDSVIS